MNKTKAELGDVRWSSRRSRLDWHFLSISPRDIGLLSAEHTSSTAPSCKDEAHEEEASPTALGPSGLGVLSDYSSLESQLFQYCKWFTFEEKEQTGKC